MCRDNRTTEQLQGSITAASRLARSISDDPMATPQQKHLRDELHTQINVELTELDHRRTHR